MSERISTEVRSESVLPNLLVIGVQKGGTTWLHRALAAHPDVFMSSKKELSFFNQDKSNLDEYASHFVAGHDRQYRGESTPGYFWSTLAPSRITAGRVHRMLGPDVKLLVSFRHPVKRAISAYLHHWRMGRLRGDEPLSDVADRHGIAAVGYYRKNTEGWLSVFPQRQFIFLATDCLQSDSRGVMEEVFGHLGLPNVELSEKEIAPFHVGFELARSDNGLTVCAKSRARANRKIGKFERMRKDFVHPIITEKCIRRLEGWFASDIDYVEKYILEKDLGWRGEKPMEFYLS